MSTEQKNKNNRTKFNVDKDTERRTCDGIIFASILEMKYYRDMILPQMRSGYIVKCELQKPYELQPKFIHESKTVQPITYVADFYIEYKNGKSLVIDTKGFPDSVAKIKRKMFWYLYPDIQYQWIGYSQIDGGFCDYDYIQQQRKLRKKLKENK